MRTSRTIVVINQQSVYGTGLANATINRFVALGGANEARSSTLPTATDFTPTLTTAQSEYQAAVAKYGASSVAVVAIGFQEVGQMLIQAKSSFPSLLEATLVRIGRRVAEHRLHQLDQRESADSSQVKADQHHRRVPAAATAKTNAFVAEFTAAADGQAPTRTR